MAATTIANLWTPDVWLQVMDEMMRHLSSFINSSSVMRTPMFDALASGGGITLNFPYFNDVTDTPDVPQIEGTAPAINPITAGKQITTPIRRVVAFGRTALSAAVTGTEPANSIMRQIVMRRLKAGQTTAENMLSGIFGCGSGVGGAGALAANRNDLFSENPGPNPGANNLISPFNFIDTTTALGELKDTTLGGCVFLHPTIHSALCKQDQISFTHYSEQGAISLGNATGAGQIEFYKGYRVFQSINLSRAGTGSGVVYFTYIVGPNCFGFGEKPQVMGPPNQTEPDVSSLALVYANAINDWNIYDRYQRILHPGGMAWTGTPGGQSPTDAEFATAGNWTLAFQTADRTKMACIRTNG